MPIDNRVKAAVDSAVRFNDTIGTFMQSIGVGGAPVGVRGVYDKWIPYLRTRTTSKVLLDDMGGEVKKEISLLAMEAREIGLDYATEQLSFYDIDFVWGSDNESALISVTNHAIDAAFSKHLAQQSAAELYVALGYTDEMIVGEGAETGVFTPSSTVLSTVNSTLALLWATTGMLWGSSIKETHQYEKLAVAAIDTKTTDCCLRVHGQTQPMDKPFHLIGEPRFADFIDFPPFHWYCRTASALYIPEFDFANIKTSLQSSAEAVLAERALGLQVPRSPVSGLA